MEKKLWFVIARKSSSTTGMKHSLKNTFPMYEKTTSSGKNIENSFQ